VPPYYCLYHPNCFAVIRLWQLAQTILHFLISSNTRFHLRPSRTACETPNDFVVRSMWSNSSTTVSDSPQTSQLLSLRYSVIPSLYSFLIFSLYNFALTRYSSWYLR